MARAPRPESTRFVCTAAQVRPPTPPFGVARWSEDGAARVVQLDRTSGDLTRAEVVAAQLPDASGLQERTLVVVLGTAARSGGPWGRIFSLRPPPVPRHARCSALLMRGYVDIGATTDTESSHDVAWGWSRP